MKVTGFGRRLLDPLPGGSEYSLTFFPDLMGFFFFLVPRSVPPPRGIGQICYGPASQASGLERRHSHVNRPSQPWFPTICLCMALVSKHIWCRYHRRQSRRIPLPGTQFMVISSSVQCQKWPHFIYIIPHAFISVPWVHFLCFFPLFFFLVRSGRILLRVPPFPSSRAREA